MTTRKVTLSFQTTIDGDKGDSSSEEVVSKFCDSVADALVSVEGVSPDADITTHAGENGTRVCSFGVEVEFEGIEPNATEEQQLEAIKTRLAPARSAVSAKLGDETPVAVASSDGATITFTFEAEVPTDEDKLNAWCDEIANAIGETDAFDPALSIESWPAEAGKRRLQFAAKLNEPIQVGPTEEQIQASAQALRAKVEQLHTAITAQKGVPADVSVKAG